jgi:tetratricopeptide (TPR) repeat protein
MKSILSLITLVLCLNITHIVVASDAACIQGNCKNGYGIFVFDDGRVYEGQWKKGLFEGMGKLIFVSGSMYTGEFKKGLMHGYGKINLLNGSEKKCEVINDELQIDESTKQLWVKETSSGFDEYIVFLTIGDVYKKFRNYKKSLEYYNKSLKINPNHTETLNNKIEVEKKIAEQEAKAKAQQAPTIVLKGSARPEKTKIYDGSVTPSATKQESSGSSSVNRGYQVPDKVNRLKKAAFGTGHHLSPGPVLK